MRKKVEVIDFLKGYAMLSIVVYHLGQALSLRPILAKMIDFCGTGVHTFIFVSGFGLYLSHLRQPLSFAPYLKKRFSKIYVPYIIIVALSAAISLLIPIYTNSGYAFFGHVFLYKMFDADIMASYGYQLWFISTIIQFYFIFPFLVRIKERVKAWPFILIGLVISITWGIFLVRTGRASMRNYNGAFFLYLWEFMLGMVLAEKLFVKGYEFWKIKKIYLVMLSAAGIGAYALMALTLGAYGRLLNDVPALIGYTCLSIFIYRCSVARFNSFILFIGRISYPLYLVHILILQLVLYGINYYGGAFSWPAAVMTLLVCLVIAYWLERFFGRVDQVLFGSGRATLTAKVTGIGENG